MLGLPKHTPVLVPPARLSKVLTQAGQDVIYGTDDTQEKAGR
jgi:hypothetical protein